MGIETIRVHVSLNVQSVDKSIGFYSSLFGQQASKIRSGYANFRLDSPPVHLALQEGASAINGGISHLGIELPNHQQLTEWQSRLENEGVDFAPENEAQCCYAKADKLWLTDPDGIRWEIWVRTGEHDEMGQTRPAPEQGESACC
ncbi:MAG: VOC family protein [Gammaproteobacteria bacterium]|nr:VOC family protein [Gammaproteobacteria bacterium]NNE04166.1 glyoxalase/bleomycin resistance/dioxygenase family protein [Xanthomonadales bacterium]